MNPLFSLGFLTDFGASDAYAGMLHAVALARLSPTARAQTQRVNLAHGIPPQDVRAGAWALMQALPYLPAHCAMVCVVDPDVGSGEQAVEVLYRPSYEQLFIAPANGLLAPVSHLCPDIQRVCLPLNEAQRFGWPYASVQAEASAGSTFHGRDIYTPLAANLLNHWVNGHAPLALLAGCDTLPPDSSSHALPWPNPTLEANGVFRGHILLQDSFGNGITNLPRHWLIQDEAAPPATLQLSVGDEEVRTLQLLSHYAAGKTLEAFALFGSHGHLELAAFGRPFPLPLERDTPLCVRIGP